MEPFDESRNDLVGQVVSKLGWCFIMRAPHSRQLCLNFRFVIDVFLMLTRDLDLWRLAFCTKLEVLVETSLRQDLWFVISRIPCFEILLIFEALSRMIEGKPLLQDKLSQSILWCNLVLFQAENDHTFHVILKEVIPNKSSAIAWKFFSFCWRHHVYDVE